MKKEIDEIWTIEIIELMQLIPRIKKNYFKNGIIINFQLQWLVDKYSLAYTYIMFTLYVCKIKIIRELCFTNHLLIDKINKKKSIH